MLVLSRDCDSTIRIGSDIKIKVLSIRKQRVKIGVDAPSGVRIWRDEIAPPDLQAIETTPSRPHSDAGDFQVLLAEDDADQAQLIVRALAVSDLRSVTVARTGTEVLRVLRLENGSKPRFVPALVLLDLNLSDIPAMDVLHQIRRTDALSTVPVVVLTSHGSDELAKAWLAAGANAFVVKPVRFDHFVQSISRIAAFWGNDNWVPGVASFQTA